MGIANVIMKEIANQRQQQRLGCPVDPPKTPILSFGENGKVKPISECQSLGIKGDILKHQGDELKKNFKYNG